MVLQRVLQMHELVIMRNGVIMGPRSVLRLSVRTLQIPQRIQRRLRLEHVMFMKVLARTRAHVAQLILLHAKCELRDDIIPARDLGV